MGEHDHLSTMGVPSRNEASKPGLQIPSCCARTQEANSAEVLCNQQFREWVAGLDTGLSINKQTGAASTGLLCSSAMGVIIILHVEKHS